ncbi:MAG: DUF4168 domain-containing protein [Xenococcaceae cyanobacterium]
MSINVSGNNRQRQFLLGGAVLALLLVGSLPAQTLAQELVPQPPTIQASRVEISPEELQQFVSAVKQMQAIQQASEEEMVQAVQNEGFSLQRFNEILKWKRNPEDRPPTEVTQEETQSFEKAIIQIGEIQQQTESKMKQALESEGLELPRFNQILEAVQEDQDLQLQVQQMIQN